MSQIELEESTLTLKVKKAPVLIRGMMFLFALLLFIMPSIGLLLYISAGNGLHISFAIGIFIFGLLGFYLLRVALWNTYGKEVLKFSDSKIEYIADYGWFKDGKKQIDIDSPTAYTTKQIGYVEDKKGVLKINSKNTEFYCVTKMPLKELEQLIERLNKSD